MIDMYIKGDIIYGTYGKDLVLDLDTARNLVAQRVNLQNGKRCALLIHIRGLTSVSKDVKLYMANEGSLGLTCVAFVVEGFTERCLIKMFLALEKPLAKSKIFSTEKKAESWITSLHQNLNG